MRGTPFIRIEDIGAVEVIVLAIVAAILIVGIGGLPGEIARRKKNPDAATITVLGYLGWVSFGLSWLVALIWALTPGVLVPAGEVPVQPAVAVSPPVAGTGWRPARGLWLYYLFLQPTVFFRYLVWEQRPILILAATWVLGIVEISGKISEIMLRQMVRGRSASLEEPIDTWFYYWLFCVSGGLLYGLLYYWIGGWWYRLRLRFSGAVNPDAGLTRRILIYACLVVSLPSLLYTAWETSHYSSPMEAFTGGDLLGFVPLVFVFWSVYTSYRGARTAFVLRCWPARIWFAFLPVAVYGIVFAGLVGALTAD